MFIKELRLREMKMHTETITEVSERKESEQQQQGRRWS
jgi:hypothetical protein